MPGASSAETLDAVQPPIAGESPAAPPRKSGGLILSPHARLVMVLLNYIPFTNVLAIALLAIFARGFWLLLIPAILLLIPPLAVRIATAIRPLATGKIEIGSGDFLFWWFTAQWQVIFNRLPWIEECLRLIPGFYSLWLRLWGAKVGRLVYWTAGLRILDRSLVDVGDHVVFGAAVKINPHIMMPADDDKRLVLYLAPVRIGSGALVGGMSLLTAGAFIGENEASPAMREFRPFTGWRNGRKIAAETQSR